MILKPSPKRSREGAEVLYGLLSQVRNAPKDARSYALFERRDDFSRLGIDPNDLDAHVEDDASLDLYLENAAAVAGFGDRRNRVPNSNAHAPHSSDHELALAGTLIGSRSDGIGTHCTYATPFGTFTQPFAGRVPCPKVYRASPDHGRS